jgi:hypothetical protein
MLIHPFLFVQARTKLRLFFVSAKLTLPGCLRVAATVTKAATTMVQCKKP